VIVPLEHQHAGCPPPNWFIDDPMRHLDQPCYFGLLIAAALHGAAQQQRREFQVVSDRPMRPALAGRARVVLHMSASVDETPVSRVQTETGTMRVSTPEATAFDLVRFAGAAGHLGDVATVLGELAERCSGPVLARLAALYSVPDVQRLGCLLELVGERERTGALARATRSARGGRHLISRARP
jgi:hypothetical protein